MFIWKCCTNALALNNNLFNRRASGNRFFPICFSEPETVEHAFLICHWTRAVWFGSMFKWNISADGLTSFPLWLLSKVQLISQLDPKPENSLAALCTTVWGIWKTRNIVVFDFEAPNPRGTIIQIQQMIKDIPLCKTIQTNTTL